MSWGSCVRDHESSTSLKTSILFHFVINNIKSKQWVILMMLTNRRTEVGGNSDVVNSSIGVIRVIGHRHYDVVGTEVGRHVHPPPLSGIGIP